MQYIYKRLIIKIKTISQYMYGSLKTERHIRTISKIIAKEHTGTGLMWTHYMQISMYAYNSTASPTINGLIHST